MGSVAHDKGEQVELDRDTPGQSRPLPPTMRPTTPAHTAWVTGTRAADGMQCLRPVYIQGKGQWQSSALTGAFLDTAASHRVHTGTAVSKHSC